MGPFLRIALAILLFAISLSAPVRAAVRAAEPPVASTAVTLAHRHVGGGHDSRGSHFNAGERAEGAPGKLNMPGCPVMEKCIHHKGTGGCNLGPSASDYVLQVFARSEGRLLPYETANLPPSSTVFAVFHPPKR